MTELIRSISANLLVPLAFILLSVGCDRVGAGQSRNLTVTDGTVKLDGVIGGGDAIGIEGDEVDKLVVNCLGPNRLSLSIYFTAQKNLRAVISNGATTRPVSNLTEVSRPLKYTGEQLLLTVGETPDKSGTYAGHVTSVINLTTIDVDVTCEKH